MDNMDFWKNHHLIATSECKMKGSGLPALIIGKRYDPTNITRASVVIDSESSKEHYFPINQIKDYFEVRRNAPFYVGQSVWDDIFYPGKEAKVVNIIYGTEFPIKVSDGEIKKTYTTDGRINIYMPPTLSAVPYNFKMPEQPVCNFKKDEPVLCRDLDTNPWIAGRFSHMKGGTFIVDHGEDNGVSWNKCIPFDIEKLCRI